MDLRIRLLMILGVALLAALPWTLPQWWALANPESPIAAGLPELELEARALFDALPEEEGAPRSRGACGVQETESES